MPIHRPCIPVWPRTLVESGLCEALRSVSARTKSVEISGVNIGYVASAYGGPIARSGLSSYEYVSPLCGA